MRCGLSSYFFDHLSLCAVTVTSVEILVAIVNVNNTTGLVGGRWHVPSATNDDSHIVTRTMTHNGRDKTPLNAHKWTVRQA